MLVHALRVSSSVEVVVAVALAATGEFLNGLGMRSGSLSVSWK